MIGLIAGVILGLIGLYGTHKLLKSKKKFTPDDPYKFKWEPVIILAFAGILFLWVINHG